MGAIKYRLTTTKKYSYCSTCESDVGVQLEIDPVTRQSTGRWRLSRHKDVRGPKPWPWCDGGRVVVPEVAIFTADRPIRTGSRA